MVSSLQKNHIKSWQVSMWASTIICVLLGYGFVMFLAAYLNMPGVKTESNQIYLSIVGAVLAILAHTVFRLWKGYALLKAHPEKIGTHTDNFAKYGLTQEKLRRYRRTVVIGALVYPVLYCVLVWILAAAGVMTGEEIGSFILSQEPPWSVVKMMILVFAPALAAIGLLSYRYQFSGGYYFGVEGKAAASAVDIYDPFRVRQMGLYFPYSVGPVARRGAVIQIVVCSGLFLWALL